MNTMKSMKAMKSMARKYNGSTRALLVSTTLAMVALILYMAQGSWTIVSNMLPYPQQFQLAVAPACAPNESRKYHYWTDEQLFQDAIDVASNQTSLIKVKPKIAFLFLVRGDIPLEPLWRRYFAGNEDRYSLYVHTSPNYTFPSTSFFFGKEIPSKQVQRMSRSLADAVRRLLAMALVDSENYNTWFVNLCESTIPLRSFNDTYNYLTGSELSFVQSFQPHHKYLTLPHFNSTELRKGEVWMALKRQHALTIIEDRTIYIIFEVECDRFCSFDERYFQTLLHLRDPAGIANRTTMFVDWSGNHTSSPRTFDVQSTNASLLGQITTMTEDSIYGQHHDTGARVRRANLTVHCAYNGVSGVPCFLFARKFHPSSLDAALQWITNLKDF